VLYLLDPDDGSLVVTGMIFFSTYTGCFTTCEHYCRRWFPMSLW